MIVCVCIVSNIYSIAVIILVANLTFMKMYTSTDLLYRKGKPKDFHENNIKKFV